MVIKNGRFDKTTNRKNVCKVALLSDMHIGYEIWGDYSRLDSLVSKVNSLGCDFVLQTGDQLDSGYIRTPDKMAEQSDIFYTHMQNLEIPMYCIKGNHDADVPEFTKNGVIEFNGIRFVCFSCQYVGKKTDDGSLASSGKIEDDTLEFLENELSKGKDKTQIVCCHYSIGAYEAKKFDWAILDSIVSSYNGKTVDGHRDEALAIMQKYGVNLYLNGHEHKENFIHGQVDDLPMQDVQIGSATKVFATLTITDDVFYLEQYKYNEESKAYEKNKELVLSRENILDESKPAPILDVLNKEDVIAIIDEAIKNGTITVSEGGGN